MSGISPNLTNTWIYKPMNLKVPQERHMQRKTPGPRTQTTEPKGEENFLKAARKM